MKMLLPMLLLATSACATTQQAPQPPYCANPGLSNYVRKLYVACHDKCQPIAQDQTTSPALADLPSTVINFGPGDYVLDRVDHAAIESFQSAYRDAFLFALGFASPEGAKRLNERLARSRAVAASRGMGKKWSTFVGEGIFLDARFAQSLGIDPRRQRVAVAFAYDCPSNLERWARSLERRP